MSTVLMWILLVPIICSTMLCMFLLGCHYVLRSRSGFVTRRAIREVDRQQRERQEALSALRERQFTEGLSRRDRTETSSHLQEREVSKPTRVRSRRR